MEDFTDTWEYEVYKEYILSLPDGDPIPTWEEWQNRNN